MKLIIISTLSPEEIVLADKMQQFIEIIMGGHGNKTSMELFGYNEFYGRKCISYNCT